MANGEIKLSEKAITDSLDDADSIVVVKNDGTIRRLNAEELITYIKRYLTAWTSGSGNRNTANTTGGKLVCKYNLIENKVCIIGSSFTLTDNLAVNGEVEIATINTAEARPTNQFVMELSNYAARPLAISVNTTGIIKIRNLGSATMTAGSKFNFRADYFLGV